MILKVFPDPAFIQVSLSSLEKALHSYTLSNCASPFDMKTVPAASEEEVAAAAGRERKPSQPEGSLTTKKVILLVYSS